MLSEWKVIDNAVKGMCSIAPDSLLLNNTESGMNVFIEKLCNHRDRLQCDFINFVMPLRNSEQGDTMVTLCVSSAIFGVYVLLNRYIKACQWYLLNYNKLERSVLNHKYYAMVLLPSNNLYHHSKTGLELTADVMHAVFLRCFVNHLNLLSSPDDAECKDPLMPETNNTLETPELTPENIVFCQQDARLDALLRYCAMLSTYPVIPLDMGGTVDVTITRSDLEHLDILDPGPENRRYIKSPTHPRTCVSCKLDVLCSGEIDKVEQATRLKCECVFSRSIDTSFEELYKCRTQAILRLLIIKGNLGHNKDIKYGCDCSLHKEVFTNNMKRLKMLLDSARVQ